MLIPVQYQYFEWKPPPLSETEELELGHRIALLGREQFIREFRKSMLKSRPEVKKSRIDRLSPGLRTVVLAISGVIMLSLGVLYVPIAFLLALPVIAFTLGLYFISAYFATREFEKWIDRLVAKYAAHIAKNNGAINNANDHEGFNLVVAALNHFANTMNEQVPQFRSIRKGCTNNLWGLAELSDTQIIQKFVRFPEKVDGSNMFTDGATPASLIAQAVKIHGANPSMRIKDLPNEVSRHRSAEIALKLYNALETEMDAVAIKARHQLKADADMLIKANENTVKGSDKTAELNKRNCALLDAIASNEAFVYFHSDVFKPSMNQKIGELKIFCAR